MDSALEARIAVFHEMRPPIDSNLSMDEWRAQNDRRRAKIDSMPEPAFGSLIPDRDFLEAIDRLTPIDGDFRSIWTTFYELEGVFGLSDEILRAKAKDMFDRQLIYGCDCGCRGDLSLDCDGSYERPAVDELLSAK